MKIILYNDKIIITYNFTSLTPIKTRDTMLKEVEDVECEINKQLDTAIKNGNVSYKNSCLPTRQLSFERKVKRQFFIGFVFALNFNVFQLNYLKNKK